MDFKLKLVTGEEFTIDEKTRKVLMSATISSFARVTVRLDSGETEQMELAKSAVAYIEGDPKTGSRAVPSR